MRIPPFLRDYNEVVIPTLLPPKKYSGIYFLCIGNRLAYIGRSVSVITRIATHIGEHRIEFDCMYVVPHPTQGLKEIEEAMIKYYHPPQNNCSNSKKGVPTLEDFLISFTPVSARMTSSLP